MRLVKKAAKILGILGLSLASLWIARIVFTATMFSLAIGVTACQGPIEEVYSTVRAVYDACQEESEQLYRLLLGYAEKNKSDLDWYRRSDYLWPEEMQPLVGALLTSYKNVQEHVVSGWLSFYPLSDGRWCLALDIGGLNGRQVQLHYFPHDDLPYANSQRLNGTAYGWSFTETGSY